MGRNSYRRVELRFAENLVGCFPRVGNVTERAEQCKTYKCSMIFKVCQKCSFHSAKQNDGEMWSLCRREGCWSVLTKCISNKALETFIKEGKIDFIEDAIRQSVISPGEAAPNQR